MPLNFSLADLLGGLLAFVLFALFTFAPGFVAAWSVDLLEFRRQSVAGRFAIAIPLSIGISPVLAYLVGWFFSFAGIWVVFGLIWVMLPIICLLEIRAGTLHMPVRLGKYGWIAALWLAIGLGSLIDIQIGSRLYFSVVSYDYTVRSAIVSAIARTGIPPASPFYFPGHDVLLRYHYFWLIPCGLVKLLGGPMLSARQAVIGGTLWCGLGLMGLVAAFLRFVHPSGKRSIHRRTMIGIGLLCVTGLDIIPNLFLDAMRLPMPDPEWWNEQVSSWFTCVVWVPHHTASLIAGMAGVLIIWNSGTSAKGWQRAASPVLAGLCLATSIGSSIYVAVVLAAALSVWAGILLLQRFWGEFFFAAGAGIIAVAAAAPYLLALWSSTDWGTGAGTPTASTSPPIVFAVRPFLPLAAFHQTWGNGSAFRDSVLNASLLPLNYFMELGAFLIAGIWQLWRWRNGPIETRRYRLFTVALAGTSIFICTFLRSSLIASNDLGFRGFMLCQFVLLLWTVDLLEQIPSVQRPFLNLLIAIGVASSIYEAATLRFYPVAADRLNIPRMTWLSTDHNLGRRTYALRSGYEALHRKLPDGAVVQHNPIAAVDDIPYGLYADRPVAAENLNCGATFGGDPRACPAVLAALHPIFQGTEEQSAAERTCTNFSIAAVLVKDTDPAWQKRENWIWQRRPLVSNGFVRVVPCGGGTTQTVSGFNTRKANP